jgi:hypothetical protein
LREMRKSMGDYTINFSKIVERVDGKIDKNAVMSLIETQFEEWRASTEMNTEIISKAVDQAVTDYNANSNGTPKKDTIATATCAILGATGEDIPRVQSNVLIYLHAESERFEASGYLFGSGAYHVKRGKGGGVFRVTEEYALAAQKRKGLIT